MQDVSEFPPSVVSKKRRDTFCEGLKWMCILFKIIGQKDFDKPAIFSESSENFVKEFAQGNSNRFFLASF